MDIFMPEINGYEAIKILKSNPKTKDIPVIFITSSRDSESEIQGLSLGAVDFILKPFVPEILLKRIEVHLTMEYQRKDLFFLNTSLKQMVDIKTTSVLDLQRAILLTVGELVECRDHTTGKHVERTSQMMAMLINELQRRNIYADEVSKWDVDLVLQSSLLHDLGKISIADSILLKSDKLTKEEFEQMKNHAEYGEQIIVKIQQKTAENSFLAYAKIMAGTHHEKWDGSGYPRGLAGTDIPLLGRLMAVVDVYDALISERPYKPAFSIEEATKIIVDSCGTHFDPMLKDAFINVAQNIAK
jgi:putative two-component system response regulator